MVKEIEVEELKGIRARPFGNLTLVFSNYDKEDITILIKAPKALRLFWRMKELYQI